jgi:hypothetical protein
VTKKMTLKEVGKKAMTDHAFWMKLRDDPAGTLKGMDMADADKTLVMEVLQGRITVNFKKLMDDAHKMKIPYREEEWGKSWQGMWKDDQR